MLDLTLALSDNVFTRELVDGHVHVPGIRLHPYLLHPAEIFYRQLRYSEFDVSEMSLASLIRSIDAGDRRWVAIPVFPYRTFFHTWILVRTGAGIERPEDLRGRRVGLPEYPITGAVWTRGVLRHEFGVDADEIEWVVERAAGYSLGGASNFVPPPGITITPVGEGQSLAALVQSGAVDALAVPIPGRSRLDASAGFGEDATAGGIVRPLFAEPDVERRRYRDATGLVHINHTVAVRRELVEQHPWVVPNLFEAFRAAKQDALERGRAFLEASATAGALAPEGDVRSLDPVPYGMGANHAIVDTLVRYLEEQGLIGRAVDLDEVLAAASTREEDR